MSQPRIVLIVDDEEICLTITSQMVEKIGLRAITAHDGIEALEAYQQYGHEIGCVLMDIQMPRMNGIEAFRRLKDISENVRVVIASGYLTNANQELLEPLEPVGYLNKPINFSVLSGMLSKCLRTDGQPGREGETADLLDAAPERQEEG